MYVRILYVLFTLTYRRVLVLVFCVFSGITSDFGEASRGLKIDIYYFLRVFAYNFTYRMGNLYKARGQSTVCMSSQYKMD